MVKKKMEFFYVQQHTRIRIYRLFEHMQMQKLPNIAGMTF